MFVAAPVCHFPRLAFGNGSILRHTHVFVSQYRNLIFAELLVYRLFQHFIYSINQFCVENKTIVVTYFPITWVVIMEAGSLKTYPVRIVKVVCSSLHPITKLRIELNKIKTNVTIFRRIFSKAVSVPIAVLDYLASTHQFIVGLYVAHQQPQPTIISLWQSCWTAPSPWLTWNCP